MCDLCLVVILLIIEIYTCVTLGCGSSITLKSCRFVAGLTQFFLFASESWFFVMAIDFRQSLLSPFTDYRLNLRRYHVFVWGSSLTSLVLLMSISDAAGISEFGYCWTRSTTKSTSSQFWHLNERSWAFFYVWMLLYWVYAIVVVIFAWRRLQEGLNETLRMRLRVLHSVTLYVIAIIIYWSLTFGTYVAYLALGVAECHTSSESKDISSSSSFVPPLCQDFAWLDQLMSFMITSKGYFDFIVWFQINELEEEEGGGGGRMTSNNRRGGWFSFMGRTAKDLNVDVDVDLNPQVNLALRCEVLYYTTTGIIQAVKDTRECSSPNNVREFYVQPLGAAQESMKKTEMSMNESTSSVNIIMDMISDDEVHASSFRPLEEEKNDSLLKDTGTLFMDYCPQIFESIRQHFGISAEDYISSWSTTTKERLSEGASGAFMFFSHNQQFIVKTCSGEEASFLRSIASDYRSYLLSHPASVVTRFFGCHAIRLYGSTFYFVVMANLFSSQDTIIHRRYDLKGSWVNRSASMVEKGKRVTCGHCNASYVFGSGLEVMACPRRVGKHVPNTVLKDNDLTAKVRLDMDEAEALYAQLVLDANFLARLGIMDYSLLMGVHNVEFSVTAPTTSSSTREEEDPEDQGAQSRKNQNDKGQVQQHTIRKRTSQCGSSRSTSTSTTVAETNESGSRYVAHSVVGPSRYYFGLIDILQTWNMDKRLERLVKVAILRQDPDGISAVAPMIYRDRFTLKMADILGIALHNEEVGADTVHSQL